MTDVKDEQPHLSEQRFWLIYLVVIMLGPYLSLFLTGLFSGQITIRDMAHIFEILLALPMFLLLQFTFGLLYLIPLCIFALIIGFPTWEFIVGAMLDKQIHPRICLAVAAIGVTLLVALLTDMVLLYIFNFGDEFLITKHLAVGPAVVAIMLTQWFMMPKRS